MFLFLFYCLFSISKSMCELSHVYFLIYNWLDNVRFNIDSEMNWIGITLGIWKDLGYVKHSIFCGFYQDWEAGVITCNFSFIVLSHNLTTNVNKTSNNHRCFCLNSSTRLPKVRWLLLKRRISWTRIRVFPERIRIHVRSNSGLTGSK
jgi:hypothetical protein